VTTRRPGYIAVVSGVRQERSFDVECPHCHKTFAGGPIEGGRAARYLGFKCPHCKLFVPLQRATDAELTRDPDSAS
jgi:phage FluMu protein Com